MARWQGAVRRRHAGPRLGRRAVRGAGAAAPHGEISCGTAAGLAMGVTKARPSPAPAAKPRGPVPGPAPRLAASVSPVRRLLWGTPTPAAPQVMRQVDPRDDPARFD